MSHLTLPHVYQATEGANAPPSRTRLFWLLVVPMSLLPPLMYVYSYLHHPGTVLPILTPAPGVLEFLLAGAVFFAAELAAVSVMADYVEELGEAHDAPLMREDAYALAATAPVPLWLATLSLLLPSMAFAMFCLGAAWLGSVGIIRAEVATLFGDRLPQKVDRLSITLSAMGVLTWLALMVLLALLMSLMVGLR